jgi:hypothetical protein
MAEAKIKSDKINSLIESIGVKFFTRFSKKLKAERTIKLKDIPSDRVLEVVSKNLTLNAIIIAFLVGALTTIPAVLFEIYYHNVWDSFSYYFWLSLITLFFLLIELAVLYWLGIRSTYTLAYLTGYNENEESSLPPEYDVKKMMVRSALEIEDPAIEYLGIDPQKYVSGYWLFIQAILYKAKIILTTILAKLLLRKFIMRYGLRINLVWVAIPVTAIWDAIVMYRVVNDAKLRLFGYHLSKYIADEMINDTFLKNYSKEIREGSIRAISTIMVLSKTYHPNNVLLLIRLNEHLLIEEEKNYDNLEIYLEFLSKCSLKEKHLLRTLSGMAAVFDGKMNRDEKKALMKIFGEEYAYYIEFTKSLKALLIEGHLHKAAELCELMILND